MTVLDAVGLYYDAWANKKGDLSGVPLAPGFRFRLGHAAVQQALERDHVREMDLLPVLSRSGPAGARTGFLGPALSIWPMAVRSEAGWEMPAWQGAFR
jgi:hypothetical protein